MHVHFTKRFLLVAYCQVWLLLLLHVAATDSSASIQSSSTEVVGCAEAQAAQGSIGSCSSGNSLLQLASKPTRTHAVTAPVDDEEEDELSSDRQGASPAVSQVSAIQKASQSQTTKADKAPKQPVVAVVTEEMLEVAAMRAGLDAGIQHVKHSMYTAYQTRGVLSISVFAFICLVGMLILCNIVNLRESGGTGVSRSPSTHGPASRLLAKHGDGSSQTASSSQANQRTHAFHGSPPSPVMLPSQPTSSGHITLCPGLVVPANSDCVLVIRMVQQLQVHGQETGDAAAGSPAIQRRQGALELDIFDLVGKPVLSASTTLPWPKEGNPVVSIRTLNAQSGWLTLCRTGSGKNSVYIYDKDDKLFGSIQKDPSQPRYAMNSSTDELLLLFEGKFEAHRVSVLDGSRTMIAHSEPCKMKFEPEGRFYQTRIAAGVDVGLVLAGLLSIDAMES